MNSKKTISLKYNIQYNNKLCVCKTKGTMNSNDKLQCILYVFKLALVCNTKVAPSKC